MKNRVSLLEIPKSYEPKEEKELYAFWEQGGYFTPSSSSKPPFSIVIPPPNVTGSLHMGHALNNTIQDILVRFKRMQGFNVLWLPGTDHAGIATQNVVEKAIAKEGKKREDLGREEFLKNVWSWKKEYGNRIIEQLKRLGCSCDWTKLRFTMDEGLSRAVREVFVRLYNEGLIYRDNYIINWCPRCQTAISDIEVSYNEMDGFLYYIKYPLKECEMDYIVVATTRPETMLGDTAVAVNPDDERYKDLIGKMAILPLANREIPIIASSFVQMDFGTGALKITPAHDPDDFVIGKKHNLFQIKVIDERGMMNENAFSYRGLDRLEARKRIVEDLGNLIEKIEPYKYNLGHCYRCHSVIEPYLSKQWFVKMKPLAERGISCVLEKKTRFIPDNWEKIYLEWMGNIRDWCISRQIWWGHRIPVWYCKDCGETMVEIKDPVECKCKSKNIFQDEDVLDTWFSSALWPFSTMGWPEETSYLKTFYPTSVLVTGFDIIFFWVARMIMMGLKFMDDVPFRDVYIHGLIRTEEGKKMSKSSGNIIDPLLLIEKYGCDSLRLTLAAMCSAGRDILIKEERIEGYKHFMNKLWNAGRFILMNLDKSPIPNLQSPIPKTLAEKWIFIRLSQVIKEVTNCLEEFSFNQASSSLYSFFWHEYCDWFIEIEKDELKKRKGEASYLLRESFCVILRLLHPFIPFITEKLWMMFKKQSIMASEWPKPFIIEEDKDALQKMELVKEIVVKIRNTKAIMGIPNKSISCFIKSREFEGKDYIKRLANVELSFNETIEKPEKSVVLVASGIEIYLIMDIELEKQKQRLDKEIKKSMCLGRREENLNLF
ncbi:MAG: valine--tRNA ligase [bacterium]